MNLFIHGIDREHSVGQLLPLTTSMPPSGPTTLSPSSLQRTAPREKTAGAPRRYPTRTPPHGKQPQEPLAVRNANTCGSCTLPFASGRGSTAGSLWQPVSFPMARLHGWKSERRWLENNYVDCIVQLSGQLFANTPDSCALWFLSKNRAGQGGVRKRIGEILFIDGRKLGNLIPGPVSRSSFLPRKWSGSPLFTRNIDVPAFPAEVPGFCGVASLNISESISTH